MPHPLHEIIADLIDTGLPDGVSLIRDPACVGDQRIPLFISALRSRATWLCDVDSLIVVAGHIKAIIEVDESDVSPTQIMGKFFTSAIASHYIHDNAGAAVPKAESVTFLQFLSTSGLPHGSSKIQQWKNIAERIRGLLPIGNVRQYYLFYGGPDDFRSGELLRQVDHAVAGAIR